MCVREGPYCRIHTPLLFLRCNMAFRNRLLLNLGLNQGFMVSFLKLVESRAMLRLEGGLLKEKYVKVWAMRRQWQLRKSLEITPNHSSPVFFPCQGLGATDSGCWEFCCSLELCCCSAWVCPSTHPDNFPA